MRKNLRIILFATVIIIGVVGVVVIYTTQNRTEIQRLEDGNLGVETIIEETVDLEKFTFTCSAVFQVKQKEDGTFFIEKITSEFLERKRVPNVYTFSPKEEIETICENEGRSYLIQQTLHVKKSGTPVKDITVGARFNLDMKTGEMSAEQVPAK